MLKRCRSPTGSEDGRRAAGLRAGVARVLSATRRGAFSGTVSLVLRRFVGRFEFQDAAKHRAMLRGFTRSQPQRGATMMASGPEEEAVAALAVKAGP